ncbi:MAG: ABC transporter permease [Oscillospiraceae bacterium]|nr:ABC transporter permease [Oscillospiraceae bacterium]
MERITRAAKDFGLARSIILGFFLLLLVLSGVYGMSVPRMLTDVFIRWGMHGILVLAMVPSIQSGIGPNFGVSIGIIGGLLGALISIELRAAGAFLGLGSGDREVGQAADAVATNGAAYGDYLADYYEIVGGGFFNYVGQLPGADVVVQIIVAMIIGLFFAAIFGILYGMLLNRVKGSEMMISTYVGFSVVAFFNIMWLVLPFRAGTSIWPIAGAGLRVQISLVDDFSRVFNHLWAVSIGGLIIPTGLLLVFFLFCVIIWLFMRSRSGMMMSAAGANPSFAKAAGINVNRMRILGTTISTMLGAVGIIIYAQSFGFLQMYSAPLFMGFTTVAAILIGGASINRAWIFNVLLGAFLFQGILVTGPAVANQLVPEGNLSEIARIIISNGIILYALTKAKEVAR